jgi:uncharacterized membrane protein YiaA
MVATKDRMINTIRFFGLSILTIGILLFLIGFFQTGSNILTPIGIGTIVSGVFIFIMGIFLVMTEEMIEKNKANWE